MRHLFPPPTPPTTIYTHHLQRHHLFCTGAGGTAPTRNSSCVSRPSVSRDCQSHGGDSTLYSRLTGHLNHQTGNKPGNIPCDSLVIGQPAIDLYEGIIRYAAIAGNARGPQPWRARPRQLVRVEQRRCGGFRSSSVRHSLAHTPPPRLCEASKSRRGRGSQSLRPRDIECGRPPPPATRNALTDLTC